MRSFRSSLFVLGVAVTLAAGCSSSRSPVTAKASTPSASSSPSSSDTNPATTDGTADTSAASTPDTVATASLQWSACTDEIAQVPELECATLTVPLDHDDPDADTIDLALIRLPASDSPRIGAVLFNPGGPGGSGFDYVAQAATSMSTEMGLEQFDIVGFDPRGVDRSNGIRCLSDADLDKYAYLDDTPDTPEEQALLDEDDTAFATACAAKYGDALQYYSTAQTAQDMDAIRIAMGDEQISYIGVSYGTYLGAVYASMFPDHVRAMVLDSAYEPSGDSVEEQYKTQLVGFEHAFDDWATWCAGNSDCAFGQGSSDVGAKWDSLRQQLDDTPITATDGRVANQALLDSATFAALYSKAEWPVLGAALADVAGGDVTSLFRLADGYSGRSPDGTYTTIEQSNQVIRCASGIVSAPPPDPEALAADMRAVAPRFGKDITAEDLAKPDQCTTLMPEQPIDVLDYSGEAPIVVVGGENDPATPIRWAEEMTADLGPSAVLLTYSGEGHGQLLASKCVTAAEAAVLVDLQLPDPGTTCAPDPEIAQPQWWNSVPLPDGVDPVLDSPELLAALGLGPTQAYGELHTTTLSNDDAIAAYKSAMDSAGFPLLGEQEPLPSVPQAVFQAPDGTFFSMLVISQDAMKNPPLDDLQPLVPEGKSLIALLAIAP